MPLLDFIGDGWTKDRSIDADSQVMVNFFIEKTSEGSKYPKVVYPTPGLEEFSDLNGLVVRGALEFDGYLYTVCDNKFYKVDQNGTATQKGTLVITGFSNVVTILTNGSQICVVDMGNGYVYNINSDTFVQITDPNFVAAQPTTMTFQDGYGIYNQSGTNKWWITNLNDFSVTDDLDFASATTINEDIVAIVSNRQQLYIFTRFGVEVWFDAGTADFPFARKNTSYSTQGLAAQNSVALIDNTLYYLASSYQGEGFVVKIDGDSAPVVVSNPAISSAINSMDTISDAIGFAYEDNGHLFYVLTFPTSDRTMVYDLSTGMWHERTSSILNDPGAGYRQGRFRANCYAFLGRNHIVGDFQNGLLYRMASDIYTENDLPIQRTIVSPHFWNELKRVSCSSLTLDWQVGTAAIGEDEPTINVSISKDGGFTYGNPRALGLGTTGQYAKRVKTNRLGQGRDFVIKITTAAATELVFLGAAADVTMDDS